MSGEADRQIKIASTPGSGPLGFVDDGFLGWRGLVVAVLAAVLMRTAWIGDDAMISLHQVRLLVAGEGMVWNPGVRVQAFTHPTWFGVLSLAHLITGALFWPAILLGAGFTIGAVLLLWSFAREHVVFTGAGATLLALSVLLSRGFVDYGTSGLENGLSFFLAAIAVWLVSFRPIGVWIWVVLALLVLNRLDHAVLFGPLALVLLATAWREGRIWTVLPGLALIVGWLAFATIYFGSPFPNTFYAKLAAGQSIAERLNNGVFYINDAFERDGFTPGMILLGIVAGFQRGGMARFLALGCMLHLAYLVWIGGDFMRGRFLAVPFLVSLFLIASAMTPVKLRAWGVALAGAALLLGHPPPLDQDYHHHTVIGGIADERGFYFQRYGLTAPAAELPRVPEGSFATAQPQVAWIGCGGIGHSRFSATPKAFLIDSCALADPFLARLPVPKGLPQRIGHASRLLPANYGAVVTGKASPSAGAALYDETMLIAAGPIWSSERLAAIGRRLIGMGESAPEIFRTGGSRDLIFIESLSAVPWYEAVANANSRPRGGSSLPQSER
ncbi:MAG: hypothetical protein AAF415_19325 [Pseudomonadota bacterium]